MATYLGPLTTIFTPPTSCLNTWYRNAYSDGVSLLDKPECFPTNFVNTGFYSPGFSCPRYYQGISSGDGAETTVICCPSQFTFSGPYPGSCITSSTSNTVTVIVTGDSSTPTWTQYYDNPTVGPLGASAIELRFRSADLATTTSSSSSTTESVISSTTSTATTATATATAATSLNNTAPGGLSTGAKIGIGVAVPVVVLALLAVLAGFYFRRRKAKQADTNFQSTEPKWIQQQQSLQQKLVPIDTACETSPPDPVELDSRGRYALVEMDAGRS